MDRLYISEKKFDAFANNTTETRGMAKEGDNETTESTASTETKKYKKQEKWSELPSPPLENIYSFLCRSDQVNMSLVCHKWSEGYGLPSVWKTFRFALKESQVLIDNCHLMKFARKYSSMFRHVEIFCIRSSKQHVIRTWCRHFIAFLEILTSNSQLISVKFLYLAVCFAYTDSSTSGDVYKAIINFLGSQYRLKRAEFDRCLFGLQEWAELLKELTENSRESLAHLGLRGFFYYDSMNNDQDFIAEILPTLVGLPSLTTLETDYSLIFENMFTHQSADIRTLQKCENRVLSKITLNYDNDSMKIEDFRGLTSADWRFLKKLYPDIQVEFTFTGDLPTQREVEFFIVPNMPITRLNYIYEKINLELPQSSLMEINVMLDRLLSCKISDHLISLHLKWVLPISDLASIFIPFIYACKKLRCLKLSIVYPANGIILLIQSWLKNRPECLEKVYMAISGLNYEDNYRSFIHSITEYESLLRRIGINIKVDFIFGVGLRLT